MPPQPKFGQRIKDLRIEKGLTLEQLAEATDGAKSYIWELENKNPPRPSAEKLLAIAKVLDVTVDYLLGADGQTKVDAHDHAFFREYSAMDPSARAKLRSFAKILGETDE